MPKSVIPQLPLQGIFALAKPSGPTTMGLLTRLKPLFSSSKLFMEPDKLQALTPSISEKMKKTYPGPTLPGELTGKDRGKDKKKGKGRTNWKKVTKQYLKMGSGGTLDPLADGVLIIGVGSGTKDLSLFLNCTKTYRTTGLLGCETDSYDSEGAVTLLAPWRYVTKALIEENLIQFRGEIDQIPPIYSALKVDGKPLYDYARQNKPLPRPIEARKVTISRLDLTDFSSAHSFRFPTKVLDDAQMEERKKVMRLLETVEGANGNIENSKTITEKPSDNTQSDVDTTSLVQQPATVDDIPPIFELEMAVSGGTYVRSVVHDLGRAVGSAAHVVVLTRVQQGPFLLGLDDGTGFVPHDQPAPDAGAIPSDGSAAVADPELEFGKGYACVEWKILENAVLKWENDEEIEVDDDGWAEWELEILKKWPKQGDWRGLGNAKGTLLEGEIEATS